MRPLFSSFPLFFALFHVVFGVKPVWKTPVSEPNPNANVEVLKEHSNLAKRAQPNYYTRPEQVSIPDYRPPRQRVPPLPPPPSQQKYQQLPPHQITSGGSFRPFAWVGPQPKAGSPQTSYYEKAPNKGQFPHGLPPLPPNWQQYPVQMIWIPDTPGQTTGAYPYYPVSGPVGPPVSTGSYGLYGPSVTTEEPMKPSAFPETYTGTVAHSPAVNPITTTIPYEPGNPYGGRQVEVSPSSNSPYSSSVTSSATSASTNPFVETTNPYEQSTSTDQGNDYTSTNNPRTSTSTGGGVGNQGPGPSSTRHFGNGNGSGKTVNPTIRPGPQEPSGGGGTTPKSKTTIRLPFDADSTRTVTSGRTSESPRSTTSSETSSTPSAGGNLNSFSTRLSASYSPETIPTSSTSSERPTSSKPSTPKEKETTLFEMTTNPFGETIEGKTVPPIYLGSDEEDEEPPEDISKVTDTPESSEHTQIPGSPGSVRNPVPAKSTESTGSFESPESSESDRENENGESVTPTPQQEEEEMMKNFFPRPVSSQAYQPPGHQPEDFTSHINVNFKKPKGKGGCVTPPCRGVDTDKISLYKPDRDNEGTGPTLVISNAAKDDASRAGYKPAPPPVNPYIPPSGQPNPEEEYATPYTVPPGKQPFPPFGGGAATPPRSLIPAHNFPPPSTLPPEEDYHETTADTIHPTAQTISTRFTAPPTSTTPRPIESTTTEEDIPEYVPPAIVHMTASTPRGKNPPTYVPLHPETSASQSTPNPTTSSRTSETQTPASITRQPEFPSRPVPPFGGNFPHGPSSSTVPPFGGNIPPGPSSSTVPPFGGNIPRGPSSSTVSPFGGNIPRGPSSSTAPPFGGNFPHGPSSSTVPPSRFSNPTTEGSFTEVFTDRERTDSGESATSTPFSSTPSVRNSQPPTSSESFTSTPGRTTGGWIYTTPESSTPSGPESEYSTVSVPSSFPTLATSETSENFTPSESFSTSPSGPSSEFTTSSTPSEFNTDRFTPSSGASESTTPSIRSSSTERFTPSFAGASESFTPPSPTSSGIFSTITPEQFEEVTSTSTDRFRPSEFATSPTPPSPTKVVTASFPPDQGSSPGVVPNTNPPPRINPYAPPEGAPRVPNRLIGKPRILCLEDGISFEVKTILPLTGEVFANDRKRIPECQKTFTEDSKPKVFLPFATCGVKNVGEQVDSRAQYHMQVVLILDQGNGTNTLQSFMAQCVHQKVNYNKQVLPKRIEEALEELRLVPSKLEQKASMPSVQMQIVVDEGHHKLGAEVSAADIGMPLALKWSMVPESDAYGMHIRNCKVVDAVGKLDHTLIDEQGCSADLQIIDHPHYDTYHDTASAHMWAFKVPDMSSLQIKCDILICSNIKSSVTNTTSCEDIPSPPFCADVVTSPPNSILSDASSFIKHRRASVTSEVSTSTQSVRTSICLSKTCRPDFSEEVRICVNTQLATTSTGLSVAFLLIAISFQVIARTKRA